MKTYSIGRDLNCDIVINDSSDVISRRHALLNVAPSGKMTIIDQSSNGTYVNGIRITQNVSVPVTRKDIVSLAHVAKLDWEQVPKSNLWIKYAVGAVVAVVVVIAAVFGVRHLNTEPDYNSEGNSVLAEKIDSTALKQKEAARQDSIKDVAHQDSIKRVSEKARQDSINGSKKASQPKKETKKTKKEDESKGDKENGKPSKTNRRPIG